MTQTNISSLAIMIVVGLGVFMGMFSFMSDLKTAGYNITTPTGSEDDIDTLFSNMNQTATDLEHTLTGEQSWIQTAYSIFFRLPNTAIGTLSTVANNAGKLMSITLGEESGLPIPSWIPSIILILIGIIISFTLLYLVLGRRA